MRDCDLHLCINEDLKSDCETHRVVAALLDKDSVGKSLIVDLDAECSLSAVQRVLLNKIQVVYSSNLHVEKGKKKKKLTEDV